MKKHVWIINHYAAKMFEDEGGRHYWLARELKKQGYEPVVFCASTIHNTDRAVDLGGAPVLAKEAEGVPFVFLQAPPYHGNGVSRFRNMLAFTHAWEKRVDEFAQRFGKPDIIYASSVHPFSVAAAIRVAKRLGVPCLAEFRDLWPDVLVDMGALSAHHPLTAVLRHLEKYICKHADGVVFTMQGGREYLRDKGYDRFTDLKKVFYLNNGVDLQAFDRNVREYSTQDADLSDTGCFRLVYAGSVRFANKLDLLLDAAKLVQQGGYDKIRFLCWGQGDELARLRARVQQEKITNVVFKGGVGRQYVPSLLTQGDACLLHCEAIYGMQYGVSFLKLFDYLAAGKPILSTVKMGHSILDEMHCGLTSARHDAQSIAESVIALYQMPPDARAALGQNARQAAAAYDVPSLGRQLSEIFESL